jgi:hypothetical protein
MACGYPTITESARPSSAPRARSSPQTSHEQVEQFENRGVGVSALEGRPVITSNWRLDPVRLAAGSLGSFEVG